MTSGETPELPFYMRGNFAPVREEKTSFDLPVEGAIPPELDGLYLRNGPNPKSGVPPHWFLGDGMLHGVRLEGGRAAWYRNRWVRTRSLEEGLSFVSDDGSIDHSVGLANTHVVAHAGRIFALVESSFPTEVTPELETVGVCDFEGRLTTSMTAHPKACPVTGELHFFGYRFAPPYLTYHRLDASGKLVRSEVIDVPAPTMMHDFAITERRVIFMDLPIVFTPERVAEGRFPYAWSDDLPARLGVMPRDGGAADVRWLEIEPCYIFHPFNAFDDGESVVLDAARYPSLWKRGESRFDPAFLHRFRIDLEAEKVAERRLDDRPIEFPRVDERRGGLPHRYGYAACFPEDVGGPARSLVRYDLETGASVTCELRPEQSPGEGVFAPAGAGEDEGYVLAYAYDAARDGSDLLIFDASRFGSPPVATVRLPQRVPFGFHGSWIDAGSL